jgi:hypothetical protein
MKSRRRIAFSKAQDCADYRSQKIRLQQGFAPGEMGFNRYFAQQQFSMAHVRFGSKADKRRLTNVRFTPKSGHRNSAARCLLCAKSGHSH